MLSSEEKFARGVVSKRLKKTLIPYLLWSAFYWLAFERHTPASAVLAFLLGGAGGQMYYLHVYAQLVLLTPWLYRLLKSHRALIYAVTPCILIIREGLAVAGIAIPHIQTFFPLWLIYYLTGLDWENVRERVAKWHTTATILGVPIGLALQLASGLAWNAFGDYNLATTQLKLTSMLSSIFVILALMRLREVIDGTNMPSVMVTLGDVSFGVYLCHITVLAILRKAFKLLFLTGFAWAFPLWLLTVCISALLVRLCQKMLPKRALSIIGFV